MSKKLTTQEFIERARAVHGDLYDYSKVVYVNAHTKVTIIDPEFGEWEQLSTKHLSGQGNPKRAARIRAENSAVRHKNSLRRLAPFTAICTTILKLCTKERTQKSQSLIQILGNGNKNLIAICVGREIQNEGH